MKWNNFPQVLPPADTDVLAVIMNKDGERGPYILEYELTTWNCYGGWRLNRRQNKYWFVVGWMKIPEFEVTNDTIRDPEIAARSSAYMVEEM
jgi:hypothetical protein